MAALRVRNVNLLRRRELITEAVADVNGHAVFGTPKTHQRRQVPVPRFLADELAAHVAGKAPADFVFTAEKGGLLHLRNFRRLSFDPAVRAASRDSPRTDYGTPPPPWPSPAAPTSKSCRPCSGTSRPP
ncbi:hypothetical protein [Geodermatophilus normandii]|uniref:hypothetical protein n=1 Tax=Geodermatophilus normandii TaxID=1137989 RepID=UPI001EF898B5|nr:hypothetical protein [Geodermatophilus normandii]